MRVAIVATNCTLVGAVTCVTRWVSVYRGRAAAAKVSHEIRINDIN